ncbi:MAG: RdgB/HAM1 family non-canonical purine NTP pyrophosphatase [Candidatus Wallbacteria bacterium]|nr:RdgB/HAM1 family non-canonical purine NTP pyrophosphatase [Candidatus Wallbacteria bacterium]
MDRLLVATHNAGKLREIAEALRGHVGQVVGQGEVAGAPGPAEESADSYRGNALLKARALHRVSGQATMADDSGLEVEALGGRPGLHSSRYGETDGGRISRLLEELHGVESERRGARFVCTIALVLPDGEQHFFEGVCAGRILESPRGTGGFGFDPVFLVEESGRAMAELSIEEKNRVSHRARALSSMRDWLGRS